MYTNTLYLRCYMFHFHLRHPQGALYQDKTYNNVVGYESSSYYISVLLQPK
jgi:hypothetical protein